MPRTHAKTLVHLILSTKNREPLMDHDLRDELHGCIVQILRELRLPPIHINSVPDHLHVLYCHSKKHRIERIAEELKKRSIQWMETKGPRYSSFCWQLGCRGSYVRQSRLGTAVEYMLRQKQHQRTFVQEYQTFLKRYGLAAEKPFKKGTSRPFEAESY